MKLIATLLCFHLVLYTCGQSSIKKFIKENAVSITSINPDAANFSDLEIIGTAIGNSRIVMLGEQDHGDAPTFLAKTRLIKYLHEKKGFNVLAFESDFFALNDGWDKLVKTKPFMDSFIRKNIFPIWTYCHTCDDLFYRYVPASFNTNTPIQITGFDNQMILQHSSENLAAQLDSVLHALDLPVTKQPNYHSGILPTIDSVKYLYSTASRNPDFHAKCDSYLHQICREAGEKLDKDDFWSQVLNNLIQENREYQLLRQNSWQGVRVRDSQMAVNLRWLADVKYPKEKIIVWAANGHVAKSSAISKNFAHAMGSYFTADSVWNSQTYVMGFTSYEGTAGRLGWENYKVKKPPSQSFENWIGKSMDYAFVNFKGLPYKGERFYLKGQMHNPVQIDWANIFDGVFFIRKMYPCNK